MIRAFAAACATSVLVTPLPALLAQDTDKPSAVESAKTSARVAEAVWPSLVRVLYHVRYDKGEAPPYEEMLRLERPHEEPGWLYERGMVVTEDIMIHPRFIERIEVAYTRPGAGESVVEATPVSYGVRQDAMFLRLEADLEGSRPLTFEGGTTGSLHTVQFSEEEGLWRVSVGSLPGGVAMRADIPPHIAVPTQTLVVDSEGRAQGLTMTGLLDPGGSWRASPAAWEKVDAEETRDTAERIAKMSGLSVPRVTLNFRSPRTRSSPMWAYQNSDDSEAITEWIGSGIALSEREVLVLANLKPKTTARLERIRVFIPTSADSDTQREISAEFVGSLKDWGGLVVRTDAPLPGYARPVEASLLDLRDRLIYNAQISVQGETRRVHVRRDWLRRYFRGWKGMVFLQEPAESGGSYYPGYGQYGGEGSGIFNFKFTPAGELIAIPIAQRPKATVEEWQTMMLMAPYAAVRQAASSAVFDADNQPLSEDDEARIAWLGVELQPLDQELARLNDVAGQTMDGATGAIVTHIYPGSPADRIGLQLGDILLRIHAPEHPRPLEVTLEQDFSSQWSQIWSQLNQIPAEYFEQLPSPWPTVENAFNRSLTNLGFGAEVELEYARGGEVRRAPLEVVQGPKHFGAAARYKADDLGLTVRDITYEVRRYFRLTEEDPGVILSKIEPGERAAIAGLKPYEIVTHVNEEPVFTAEQFEELVKETDDLSLSIKRRDQGRVVKIRR